ncbi:RidA family protein [Amycolatopsis jejuensis]|uniref:RidA family protein n=1 Tax=Amycolatopsis jejuensis TaxID=330084 RepID=UPI00052714AF|nr:RidA family protein [Amycolatopsis jejuensis]
MVKRVVDTGSAQGSYSSAVVIGNHCYVSGTGGLLPGTAQLVDGGIETEITQALKNLASTVEAAGFTLADVVSTTCYLRSLDDWPTLDAVYRTYFVSEPPTRAAVVVNDMPFGANIEITAIAVRDTDE